MKTITCLSIPVLLLFLSVSLKAQLVPISGTVQDVLSGKLIKQISVVDQKSGIGTISSENGSYFLLLKSGEVNLIFSDDKYSTYATRFDLKNDTVIHVRLEPTQPQAGRKFKQDADGESGYAANQVSGKK
jgi:hypothetical protein